MRLASPPRAWAGGKYMIEADPGEQGALDGRVLDWLPRGTDWYADSTVSASGNGKSWGAAFKTITEAESAAKAGDRIKMFGSFAESVTVAKAGLRFIGCGTCPKQTIWAPAAGNDKVNLTLNAAYCEAQNIYFSPGPQSSGYSACIVLGTAAAHSQIKRNRFQGSEGAYYAIYIPATGPDNVHIYDNEFRYFNTATYGAAIKAVEASPWNAFSAWEIVGNDFDSCVTAIDFAARNCRIERNLIRVAGITAAGAVGTVCTMGIDLSGHGAEVGANMVWRNLLDGAFGATLYVRAAASDCWAGNDNVAGETTADPT